MGNGPHRVWAGVSGVAAQELVEELGNLLVGPVVVGLDIIFSMATASASVSCLRRTPLFLLPVRCRAILVLPRRLD